MPLIWHKLVAVNIWKREIKFRPMPLQLNWLKECLHSDTYNFPSTQSNSLYQWTSSGHFGQAGFMLKRVSAYMCTFSKAAPILAARQSWVCVLPLPFFFLFGVGARCSDGCCFSPFQCGSEVHCSWCRNWLHFFLVLQSDVQERLVFSLFQF